MFLNPWILAGLAAVGLPVLIHLLNRHKARTIEWGAMELLRRVVRVRARRIRLEDILLMLLRCLVILLLVLAVARPVTSRLAGLKEPDAGVVVALDASYSMAHGGPGEETRFEDAVARARRVLDTVPGGGPVTLVTLGARPRVHLRAAGYDPERVRQVLAGLRPRPEPLRLEACLEALEPLLAELKVPEKELYLVTDGQASTWADLSDAAREGLRRLSETGRVRFVLTTGGSESNVAITRLDPAGGQVRPGGLVRYVAEVRNAGARPVDAGHVDLLVGGEPIDRRFVGTLAPGENRAVSLYLPVTDDGTVRLEARLEADALAVDNVRYAAAEAGRAVRVLCVDGRPSPRPGRGAAGYIVAALAEEPGAASASALSVLRVPWLSLPSARLSDYDVVMLADVPEVPEGTAGPLRRFVERGGGLFVFAGPNMEIAAWNERLAAAPGDGDETAEPPLLPARLTGLRDLVSLRGGPVPLATDLPPHPLTAPLADLPVELLSENRVSRLLGVEPLPGTRVLLSLAGGGGPLLLERRLGRGTVLLWTTSPDRQWNNLVLNPAYPLLLRQAAAYLARGAEERGTVVGGPLVVPMAGQHAGDAIEVRTPGGESVPVTPMAEEGEVWARLPEADEPGFYEFRLADGSTRVVAVNVDTSEADVRAASPETLAQGVTGGPDGPDGTVWAAGADLAGRIRQARTGRELWFLLAAAALVLLAVEGGVARWYTRHK